MVELDFDHGKQATSIVQDHYMERSQRMFIVNTPSFFSLIW
ncbi:unnamed protein product [Ascophyllum nodosum]